MDETKTPAELEGLALSIIDDNQFMTLATADEDGAPWASPVWYAHAHHRDFYWVSSPGAQHSRNLEVRPRVAIVIFDSHLTGGWNAVYLTATAAELADVDQGIAIYSGRSVEKGFGPWERDRVMPPAKHRLFRAVATECFVLDPHDERLPVDLA